MNEQQARATALSVLTELAPEADPARIDATESLQEQLDLDSMDFLNFVVGLSERVGIDIPEADYRRLATLDGCVAYLMGDRRVAG